MKQAFDNSISVLFGDYKVIVKVMIIEGVVMGEDCVLEDYTSKFICMSFKFRSQQSILANTMDLIMYFTAICCILFVIYFMNIYPLGISQYCDKQAMFVVTIFF